MQNHAISDISGGYYNPQGLDVEAMFEYIKTSSTHTLAGYEAPGVEQISNEELITLKCDVLIPAALKSKSPR